MFYWFEFEDGYRVCVMGFDPTEMQHEVMRHGRLVSKTPA